MRFLVDECTGPAVSRWLRDNKHEVFCVFEQARGMSDDSILSLAHTENWLIVTNDKDFGEKIFREKHPHRGIVLLRLDDERAASKIETLGKLLSEHSHEIENAFVVVTETQIRIGHTEP